MDNYVENPWLKYIGVPPRICDNPLGLYYLSLAKVSSLGKSKSDNRE